MYIFGKKGSRLDIFEYNYRWELPPPKTLIIMGYLRGFLMQIIRDIKKLEVVNKVVLFILNIIASRCQKTAYRKLSIRSSMQRTGA